MNAMMLACCDEIVKPSSNGEFWIAGILAVGVGFLFVKVVARRKWMLYGGILLALFGFAVYMWPEVFDGQGESRGILAAVSKSFSAFYPSRGGFENEFQWSSWYWLYHTLAIIYVTMILVALFAGEFLNWTLIFLRKSLRLMRFKVPINVFWGYSEEAKALAQGLDDGRDSVVFVMPESKRLWLGLDEDEDVHAVAKAGWKWVTGAPSARNWLSFEKQHFFVGPDGHANVVEAQRLIRHLIDSNFRGRMPIYVRLWPEAEDDAIYKWVDKWNNELDKIHSDIEVIAVREESIVSRKFLVEHPMLDCPDIGIDPTTASVSDAFKLLLVGFGVQGERLLGDMICDAQYLDVNGKPVKISVDVVDKDPATFGRFQGRCQEACSRYNIDFRTYDARSAAFWDWLREDWRPKYNRIVVCTQDDIINLELANEIANWFAQTYRSRKEDLKKTIFARVRRSSLVSVLSDGIDTYQLFGDIQDTYSSQWLLKDKWDEGAIFVNGVYNVDDTPKWSSKVDWYKTLEKSRGKGYWRKQTTFNKESSRASFLHIRNLLRLMGYDVWPSRPSDEEIKKKELREITEGQIGELKAYLQNEKYRHRLAASEHMRWMAFHLVRGWKKWDPTEEELKKMADGGDGGKKKVEPNSMKRVLLHANLVDFDELDEMDKRFNAVNAKNKQGRVDSMKKDDDIVLGLEAVFAAGFFVAKKEKRDNERAG